MPPCSFPEGELCCMGLRMDKVELNSTRPHQIDPRLERVG
jgi:hypothetical protein